jgi:hypothetical protein
MYAFGTSGSSQTETAGETLHYAAPSLAMAKLKQKKTEERNPGRNNC